MLYGSWLGGPLMPESHGQTPKEHKLHLFRILNQLSELKPHVNYFSKVARTKKQIIFCSLPDISHSAASHVHSQRFNSSYFSLKLLQYTAHHLLSHSLSASLFVLVVLFKPAAHSSDYC